MPCRRLVVGRPSIGSIGCPMPSSPGSTPAKPRGGIGREFWWVGPPPGSRGCGCSGRGARKHGGSHHERQAQTQALADSARDLLGRPSRKFRARLCELAWRLADGVGEIPAFLPAAIEVIHAGSLIVDDIEDKS